MGPQEVFSSFFRKLIKEKVLFYGSKSLNELFQYFVMTNYYFFYRLLKFGGCIIKAQAGVLSSFHVSPFLLRKKRTKKWKTLSSRPFF